MSIERKPIETKSVLNSIRLIMAFEALDTQ
jgi:hypothetical protein